MLDHAQDDLRRSFEEGNYLESEALLKKYKQDDIYRSKDQVLYNLESGIIYHFSGKYDSSSVYLTEAENLIDQNYTKSISRGVASFLGNDNNLVYDGEPYEDIYLNSFKALNYIQLQDWDAALVETRRMVYKMEQLDIKIKGIAEAFAKSDSNKTTDWGSKKINIQNSALSHYLAAVLYAKSGDFDDARIESEKLSIALQEQELLSDSRSSSSIDHTKLISPNNYNVLLAGFTGRAPVKVESTARIFIDDDEDDSDDDFYVKFAFPSIQVQPSEVQFVRAVINDTLNIHLDLVEEMDKVAAEVYSAKEPIIYARALTRALAKATGTKWVSNVVKKEKKWLGELISLLGFIGQEVSEKADLRGWQTMPGQAWLQVIQLPEGEHTVRIEHLNHRGRVLYYDEYNIKVSPTTELELIESIYAN